MVERAKSRFHTKIEEIDDGEIVMVEGKYFGDLSQPEHLRYSSLTLKMVVVLSFSKQKYEEPTLLWRIQRTPVVTKLMK